MSLRDRILDATVKLLREEGFAATTTKRIAAEARCAEGSIFSHFGDKGGLLASVLSVGLPEVRVLGAACEAGERTPFPEAATDVAAALIAYYRASYPIAATALADRKLFDRYSAAHRLSGSGPHIVWRMVYGFLTAQLGWGRIVDDADLKVEAIKMVGACQNAAWVDLVNGEQALPHEGRAFAARLADSFVRTLAVEPVGSGPTP
jgi:AcrR family transcriptional regulator